MKETLARVAPPAILLTLAVVRIAFGDPTPWLASVWSSPQRPAADAPAPPLVSAAATEVLDGLALGDEIGGLQVVRIAGPENHEIAVELSDGTRGMRVWIFRRGAHPYAAPASTERFDLTTGPPPPHIQTVDDERMQQVLRAIVERIEAGGADVPDAM